MLVSKKHRALVLNTRNPEKLRLVLPAAKTLMYKGRELMVVPHTVENVKVLSNLGMNAPAPIQAYYKWPGRFAPYPEQRETAAMLSQHNRAYCLNSMGVGKTISALWAYDWLRSQGLRQRALVVAPLSTLERTWADTVFEHFPHLSCTVLYGSAAKRRKLLTVNADIYVVNHHGLEILADDLNKRPDIDLIIYDELSVVRNGRSNLWKAANKIVNRPKAPRSVWGLTGTPMPNDPTDIWAQCKLVTPETVTPYFTAFRDRVMKQISTYKWAPRDGFLSVVHKAMQPSVRFALDDCVSLPEQIFTERDAPLTPEQNKAYKEMLTNLKTEQAAGEILAVNEAVKAGKLLQIAAGVAYDTSGQDVILTATHRLAAMHELIEESEGSVIVFVPFTGVLNSVVEYVGKHYSCEHIDGGVGKNERDRIFSDFQRNKCKVLVAQPRTMSHGLTLTAATTIIWYSPVTSNDTFEQANARIRRPGQTKKTVIAMLTGTTLERKLFNRLKEKRTTQGALLELFHPNHED